MKLKIFLFLLFSLFTIHYSLFTGRVQAHCPLCAAGAAAGITLTRWVGVDDSITGIWLGAFLGAISFWLYNFLALKFEKLDKYKQVAKLLLYSTVFATTIWSFYKFNLVIRMSKILGLDRLTFGMIAGGTLFYLVDLIKIKHYFNYQKIVISLGSILLLSFGMYILLNYYI